MADRSTHSIETEKTMPWFPDGDEGIPNHPLDGGVQPKAKATKANVTVKKVSVQTVKEELTHWIEWASLEALVRVYTRYVSDDAVIVTADVDTYGVSKSDLFKQGKRVT